MRCWSWWRRRLGGRVDRRHSRLAQQALPPLALNWSLRLALSDILRTHERSPRHPLNGRSERTSPKWGTRGGLVRDFAIKSNGYHIDDAGNAIATYYVDLRHPSARLPAATLIKSGRQEHAMEAGGTILIATPQYYRERGEGPMWDESEGRASRVTRESSVVDDPADLAEARLDDRELNRAVQLVGSGIKVRSTTTAVSRSTRTTNSITYSKKVWLFCTSIEPISEEEDRVWRNAMDPRYDHATYIHRPREFARALAAMVAEQLGPQGQEATMAHNFGGLGEQAPTRHKQQTVFHGPVIYVSDPYEVVSGASSDWERLLSSIFVKQDRFAPEREYRFAVWSEEEPPLEPVILNVSPAMLGSLQVHSNQLLVVPAVTPQEEPSELMEIDPKSTPSGRGDRDLVPSLLDLADDPSTRIAPYAYSSGDPPEGLHRALTTYSATQALRHAVDRLTGERKVQAASAAWHAEPCVRQLCTTFEDPVRTVRVTDDNFIVVTVRFPSGHPSEAELAFSPRGMSSCTVKCDNSEKLSRSLNAWVGGLAMTKIVKELESAGVRPRAESPNTGVADHS